MLDPSPSLSLKGRGTEFLRCAAHTQEDLDEALQAFVRVRDKLGVNA